ncbi:unnamed protein product [Arctia plantaginis]|uniref:Insulin-like domain-containing protein n=1 Tax=Arctia plantaginis TaxID=874455 RepID=A0A8S0ZTV0_ARCPL|nr:unnamed protein product [Arctia plantaginis]
MKLAVCFVLLFATTMSRGDEQKVAKMRVCGGRLPEVLNFYCQFRKDNSVIKRQHDVGNVIIPVYDGVEYNWPWIRHSGAMTLKAKRDVEGIATECCVKSCYLEEITAYCPEDEV